jgi:hypothetical protein
MKGKMGNGDTVGCRYQKLLKGCLFSAGATNFQGKSWFCAKKSFFFTAKITFAQEKTLFLENNSLRCRSGINLERCSRGPSRRRGLIQQPTVVQRL